MTQIVAVSFGVNQAYPHPRPHAKSLRHSDISWNQSEGETFDGGRDDLKLDNPKTRQSSALPTRLQEEGSRTSGVRDPSIPSASVNSAVAPPQEYFVDASVVAEYLRCSRKYILRLSRHGVIPAHPISFGRRVTWRYLLSELHAWVVGNRVPANVAENSASGRRMTDGSPRKGGR